MDGYYIWTVGCQMNKADSERLESALGQMGLESRPSPKEADVIVLNSCVVRQSAEDRVVGMMTSLKPLKQRKQDKVLALMGLHGRTQDRRTGKALPLCGCVHAAAAVPAAHRPARRAHGHGYRRLHWAFSGAPGCRHLHPHHSRLRQVLPHSASSRIGAAGKSAAPSPKSCAKPKCW